MRVALTFVVLRRDGSSQLTDVLNAVAAPHCAVGGGTSPQIVARPPNLAVLLQWQNYTILYDAYKGY